MATSHFGSKLHHGLFGWLNQIVGVFAGAKPLLELAEELMQKQAEKMLRRMLGGMAVYFILVAGVIFMTIGVIFIAIDFMIIPRGVAFTLGGLLLVLGSVLFLQLSKK